MNDQSIRRAGPKAVRSCVGQRLRFLPLAFICCHAALSQQRTSVDQILPKQQAKLAQIGDAFEKGKTAKALQMAQDLSASNGSDASLHLALGLLLTRNVHLKAAQLELERADSLQPEEFAILEALGSVFLEQLQLDKSELFSARALKIRPKSPGAMYQLAQVYGSEGRPMDALDLLLRARKLAPADVDILFLMAKLSISQKYFEDAIPLLEQGLQIAPQRTDLRATLGESYFKSDKIDKSIAEFSQVIRTRPTARAYAYLGLSYTYLGRFDEAKRAFQSGLELEPHDNFCLFHLGYVALRQGNVATASTIFEKVLASDAKFPYALLELANIQIEAKKYSEAASLLKRYIEVAPDSASGYYKLSVVERGLHDKASADRDLARFQSLSKDASVSSHPYENLFDYLDTRSRLDTDARNRMDLAELLEREKGHPDEPETLYLLAQAYLKVGRIQEARSKIAHLDEIDPADARTLTGSGVLLARYRLYDDAIKNFKAALQAAPGSNESAFDLANAYFRKGNYTDAFAAAMQVSEAGRSDDSYLELLADIYAHRGDLAEAMTIYRSAVDRNPDNDQNYLSLALIEFRQTHIEEARRVLQSGESRLPSSGKILWGLGVAAALDGDTNKAAEHFEQAVNLLPEWPGSYSTLGVYYYLTGQLEKAKEVLDRFKNSDASGTLDIARIERVLAQMPPTFSAIPQPMTEEQRKQFLQVALYLADKTL